MNSAYLCKLCLTSSSKRTCRVVVFGCLDGALSSAKSLFSFLHSSCITPCITNCLLRFLHGAKTRPRATRGGGGRSHHIFGGCKAPKEGVLPPPFLVFSPCLFCPFSFFFPPVYEISRA